MVRTNSYISWQIMNDKAYITDERTGQEMVLNETATYIFSNLLNGILVDDMAKKLSQKYQYDFSEVICDVNDVEKNLLELGVIVKDE